MLIDEMDRRTALKLWGSGWLFARALAAEDAAVVARNAWVRLPLPSKNEAALYLTLENHSADGRAVVGGASDAAQTIELHEMTMVKMVMSMHRVSEVKIPAKGRRTFDPDRYHVMLFGLKSKLSVGDTVNATLKLDDGSTVPVTATVRK
jgi:copper(I)-binding protein